MPNSTAAAAVLFDRAPLFAALSYLAGTIVEARNTIPIASCVLIEPCADGARISGTDLDMIAATVVPAAWDAQGFFAADARDLLAAVKAITGETVQLQRVAGAVLVVGDGMTSRVGVLPSENWPGATVKPFTAAAAYSTDAATLASDWTRVLRAVSYEETRYYLNGIYAHLIVTDGGAKALAYAATDGHRLAVVKRDVPAVTGADLPGVIIPRKMIAATLKAMGKRPLGDAAFQVQAHAIAVDVAGWSIVSKTIDGTFPDYSRVIPSANDLALTFDGAQLGAVAAAMSKASKGKGACKLTIATDGGAVVEQTHEDNHRAADVAADWSGGEAQGLVIGMNARYLVDVVTNAGGGALIGHFADGASPMLWKAADAPELVQVLMPMRVGNETVRDAAQEKRNAAVPAETASDVMDRTYRAAYEARDAAGMRAAIAAYRASDEHARVYGADKPFAKLMAVREHYQIAMACGRARCLSIRDAEGVEGRHVVERAKLHRAARIDTALCRMSTGSFSRIGERMRAAEAQASARAAALARLEALDGFRADDARPAIPVQLVDGTRCFVRLAHLVDVLNYSHCDVVKADGTYPRRRRTKMIHRDDIARICQPRGAKVRPVTVEPVTEAQTVAAVATETRQPDSDQVTALLATVEALAARVAQLEAMPAPAAVVAPVALYGPPAPALAPVKRQRSASEARAIVRAWKMRAALRQARRDEETLTGAYREALAAGRRALMARNEAEKRVVVLSSRRGRAAAALMRMRADRRTARREARGLETGLAQAQGQLARLQPLADALAGLIAPPAAAPLADNVVALRA